MASNFDAGEGVQGKFFLGKGVVCLRGGLTPSLFCVSGGNMIDVLFGCSVKVRPVGLDFPGFKFLFQHS